VGYPSSLALFGNVGMAIKVAMVAVFFLIDPFLNALTTHKKYVNMLSLSRMAIYSFLVACIVLLGFWGEIEFIYFQF